MRAAGVHAFGTNRPRIQQPPTRNGSVWGSELNRYVKPAAAADSNTVGELSPPGTDALLQGSPSMSASLSRLTRHSWSIRSRDCSRKMSGCVSE